MKSARQYLLSKYASEGGPNDEVFREAVSLLMHALDINEYLEAKVASQSREIEFWKAEFVKKGGKAA